MTFKEVIDLVGADDFQSGFIRIDLARQEEIAAADSDLEIRVAAILQRVKLVQPRIPTIEQYARRYDATDAREDFRVIVTEAELEGARLSSAEESAILTAIDRVRRFHTAQMTKLTKGLRRSGRGWEWHIHARDGVPRTGALGQRLVPVSRAGVYVPGGKATYPSSVIMNVVPAQVAGVDEVVIATPARPDGSLAPAVLFTARALGIKKILKAGGAYGIAGLAYGAIDNDPCDVIVGPGNRYANEAKRQLWGKVGLDMYAGPSEVVVLADESADPRFAAADLLTQIEHAPDNFGCLIVRSMLQLNEIMRELESQLLGSPRELSMREALSLHGLAIVADRPNVICEMVNHIAPEHLSLHVADPSQYLDEIHNAGCVLVGPFSAQSAADFVAGPSHTLPTSSGSRFGGPNNVMTFMKFSSMVRLTRGDLEEFNPAIREFGAMEGLPAHAKGSTIRFS